MIEFAFRDLRSEALRPRGRLETFVAISSRFAVVSGSRLVYEEEEFPVVEFAVELATWLTHGFNRERDFEFDSLSTPEAGWVWIRRHRGGWRVGSIHQTCSEMTVYASSAVESAAHTFVKNIKRGVRGELGLDIGRHFPWKYRRGAMRRA